MLSAVCSLLVRGEGVGRPTRSHMILQTQVLFSFFFFCIFFPLPFGEHQNLPLKDAGACSASKPERSTCQRTGSCPFSEL